jgi:hypothetical protein
MSRFQIDEHTLLRCAGERDAPLILEFIRGLAEYERRRDGFVSRHGLGYNQ